MGELLSWSQISFSIADAVFGPWSAYHAKTSAEMATDPKLHAALLERFADVLFRGLSGSLDRASARGEVRPDVATADLIEVLAGTTFMAMLTRPTAIGEAWVQRIADVITKGIST